MRAAVRMPWELYLGTLDWALGAALLRDSLSGRVLPSLSSRLLPPGPDHPDCGDAVEMQARGDVG